MSGSPAAVEGLRQHSAGRDCRWGCGSHCRWGCDRACGYARGGGRDYGCGCDCGSDGGCLTGAHVAAGSGTATSTGAYGAHARGSASATSTSTASAAAGCEIGDRSCATVSDGARGFGTSIGCHGAFRGAACRCATQIGAGSWARHCGSADARCDHARCCATESVKRTRSPVT